jgi:hypothetical protein
MVFLHFRSSAISFFLALLFLCFVYSFPLFAQTFDADLKQPPTTVRHLPDLKNPVSGKLHIVAVMVEFDEDDNRFTTGNGTFSAESLSFLDNPDVRIDPLPHNRSYFEAHLKFAKNYFETVSNGTLQIDYTVLPETITLSGKMEQYSPTGRNLDFRPVAELAAETWEIVNRQNLVNSIPHSEVETAFVIFHAGVGRDIELIGTTLNKTPQDIPSVYLSNDAFRDIFNDPSFDGFPLDEADTTIKNTLILPRTLSRPGEDVSGNSFVLQLSINGLVTAQIGSHIGLPDLFDTESGESGIGRLGLMDGAGIFSYNGLFPPEMSAWEKMYLGWTEPLNVSTNRNQTVELPAVSLRQNNSAVKVGLSRSEYFLIENRHRDPDGNGITIDIQKADGTVVTQTFTNNDRDFTFQLPGFEALLEPGVVISVSDYDFSLPGGLFEEDENSESFRELNGGILIWHIDENIISDKISTNSINAGVGPNGVSLMEADGAQDIGNPVSNGLFNNESNGWAFDFWWSGNDASVITQSSTIQLYENRFAPDTTPDNSSNSGTVADFELLDFSDNLPLASFTLQQLNPNSSLYTKRDLTGLRDLNISAFTSNNRYWSAYPLAIQPVNIDEEQHFIIPGINGVEIFNPEDIEFFEPNLQTGYPLQQPVWNQTLQLLTVAENPEDQNQIRLQSFKINENNFTQIWSSSAIANQGFISQSSPHFLDLDHSSEKIELATGTIIQNQSAIQVSDQIDGVSSKILDNQLIIQYPNGEKNHLIPEIQDSKRKHTGLVQQSNGELYIYLLLDDLLLLYHSSDFFSESYRINENAKIEWPAFGDVNDDGSLDILFVNKSSNMLVAKSATGATLPFFPITASDNSIFLGTPLLSDLNSDGTQSIIIQTEANSSVSLQAFDPQANPIPEFPLLVGGGVEESIGTVHPAIHDQDLLAVSPEGDLRLWSFPNNSNTLWSSKYGNGTNNKVTAFVSVDDRSPITENLIINEETYTWPNPAQNFTSIRFQTSEAADIDIDIISASGLKVFSDSAVTNGSISEEISIDTTHWSSGAYIARVKAKSALKTEQITIKIAVAK